MRTGESFNHFDYGTEENRKRYGMTYPPEYNLTLVTVPVILVHADNDPFAPPEVLWMLTSLVMFLIFDQSFLFFCLKGYHLAESQIGQFEGLDTSRASDLLSR